MGKIIFKVPESKHPFVGLGEGFIIAENGKVDPKITVTFPLHSIEITTITGEQAKILISQMASDNISNEDRIEYAKGKVCEILSIDYVKLHTKSNSDKCVMARWLVWEYAKRVLNMSLSQCSNIFNMSHSTVHNALNKLDERKENNMKNMKQWEQVAYVTFQKAIDTYSQIFEM